jgi:cytochrome c oxidase assembly protein subunit 15
MINSSRNEHATVLGYWLLFCAAVVYLMIVVGGITRLTQSGLSMVEWAPIMGIIPPLNESEWLEVFEKYRTSPEYLKVNAGMSLEAFKQIFYWEYGHRVLGRVIGLIYLLPLLYFVARGIVPRAWTGRLLFLFVLGGLQGLMGWYMVKSGLVDIPRVSHYRLAAHFGLAVIIFTLMLWYAMNFLRGENRMHSVTPRYLTATAVVVALILLMMLSGAFVAGTKAGFIMNTFPTMNGQWLPDGLLAMTPLWLNIFDNAITVQFTHRCIAVLLVCAIAYCFSIASRQRFKTNIGVLVLLLLVQLSLGISALIYQVPVILGAAHQAGAVALLSAALYVAHCARKTT